MISVHTTWLFLWMAQEFVSCVDLNKSADYLTAALGDSLTLNCTYNCSTGFVRGCWHKASDESLCLGKLTKNRFCTTSLHLSNVTADDLNTTYTCSTEDKDDPQLLKKTVRVVLLQLQAKTSAPGTPKTKTTNASHPVRPNDSSGGEFTGIKVLATVTVAVATALAALAVYLCLNRKGQSCNDKGEPAESGSGSPLPSHVVLSPGKSSMSTQSERVTLRIPTADNESDTEVPYADIMITVRGISTPELTQVGYLTPADKKERWGDEPRSHLLASRSADRLHVPGAREVSRKMSTNSEYAVIMYA